MNSPISSRLASALVAIAIALGFPVISHAGPSASDIATARQLVAEGRKLRADKDYAHAIEKLRAAYSLYRTPVTGDELSLAYRDAGRLVEARETALEVVRMVIEPDEGKASQHAREECNALVAELGKRIAEVTLVVVDGPTPAGATFTLDGAVVPLAALSEPRLVDPGNHVLIATAGNAPEQRVEFAIAEGEHRKVEVHAPKPIAEVAPPNVVTPPTTTTAPPTATATPVMVKRGPGWLTWVGLGVAGVGTAIGTFTGIQAIVVSNRLSSSGRCDNHVCQPDQSSDVKKLDSATTISTVSFVFAGVGLAAAIVDLTTSLTASPRPAGNDADTGKLGISVGLGSVSVGGSF